MRFYFVVLIGFVLGANLLAQPIANRKVEVGLYAGYKNLNLCDERLNDFTYSGNTFNCLSGTFKVSKSKSNFAVHLNYFESKLKPTSLKTGYYEYNYLLFSELNLSLGWMKTIVFQPSAISLNTGFGNYMSWTRVTEFYQSNLYLGASGYKKTYLLSLLNLSPTIEATFTNGRHSLVVNGFLSLLSLNARPDDIYVKQTNVKGTAIWKLQTINHHQEGSLLASYQYHCFQTWTASINYQFFYRGNTDYEQYGCISQTLGLGILKTF